jgi:FAD/FMN-containing dehydrogenase
LDSTVLQAFASVVGPANVLTDEESRRFYSTDVYRQADVLAAVVLRPGSVAELQQIVRACARVHAPIVVRGGGASYTDGYLPVREGTVSIDTSRLKGIEINAEDMYVTVEPGVTWAELYTALSAKGLRTPMWGPFSGLAATVGGGMSHYAVNYGSGLYGVSAESLLGMDVILASGEMISTGSGGGVGSLPFFRFYGPDLTGLFVGDAGSLGVKARMTLRLIGNPEGFAACFTARPSCWRYAISAMASLFACTSSSAMPSRRSDSAMPAACSATDASAPATSASE